MQTLIINPSSPPLLFFPCSSSHHHHHHHHHKPPIKPPPPSSSKFLNPSCITDHHLSWRLRFLSGPNTNTNTYSNTKLTVVKAVAGPDDEFLPFDESLSEEYKPKELITSEEEGRKVSWVERGWAPWEEIFSPEADFARKSLKEVEDLRLQNPDSIEAFKMLRPSYRKKRIEESGLSEDQFLAKQFDIQGEILDPLETTWSGPMVFRLMPPRDWPPKGWTVDQKELAFIREAHKLQAERLDLKKQQQGVEVEENNASSTQEQEQEQEQEDDIIMSFDLERYKVFLKQYKEWAAANKDRLEQDSYKCDPDYYPGRRKRGKDYDEDMLELPFYYPGQICAGKVTTLNLYHGAFVDIGGVYDGWIPIRDNDWYWIRQHIKVGMHVIVEILAKRDPYRFRFPIEMRFVSPNIDHLVFRRFEFPPIFHREDDTNPDELRRDCGRPPVPRIDPGIKDVEEPLLSNHPYVDKLWQLHVAEQMILDDEEANPDKFKDKKFEDLTDGTDFNEEDSVEYTQAYYKKSLLPKMIMKTNVKELNMDAARAEREVNNQLRREAEERGEVYKVVKLRRNFEMDEYDLMHWRRSFEEREALIRDISCRQTLGLPLEEPGRYVDKSYFGKDRYDPESPLYRYDYWGLPKNSEESRQQRRTDTHNAGIVLRGTAMDEMSYDEVMKQKMKKEGWEPQSKGVVMNKEVEETEDTDSDEDDDDEDDFDYSILGNPINSSNQPVVNGTSSSSLSDDEGMFEN